MTPAEMQNAVAARNAILSELNRLGLRVLAGSEDAVLAWFVSKGVSMSTANGYLELHQSDGSDVVPSKACTTLRTEHTEWFASNPRYDTISSMADFSRGTETERNRARSEYISKFGMEAYLRLPKTKEQAAIQSAEIGPQMTAREFRALSLSEKSRLTGIIGADGVAVIMSRKG